MNKTPNKEDIIKNYHELLAHGQREIRESALKIIQAGIKGANPGVGACEAVKLSGHNLLVGKREYDLSHINHIYVVGAGKGAFSIAESLEKILGSCIHKGIVAVKKGDKRRLERIKVIEAGLLDCIVNLPAKLFLNTQIPACLWFLSRRKEGRLDKVLFIDARNLGYLVNRRTKDFTDEDIARITETYHHWHNKTDNYEDVPGFCKSVILDEIRQKDYVVTPGRYIGLPEDEGDFDFAERFGKLKAELDEQMEEEARLNELIRENLSRLDIKQS